MSCAKTDIQEDVLLDTIDSLLYLCSSFSMINKNKAQTELAISNIKDMVTSLSKNISASGLLHIIDKIQHYYSTMLAEEDPNSQIYFDNFDPFVVTSRAMLSISADASIEEELEDEEFDVDKFIEELDQEYEEWVKSKQEE